MGLLSKILGMDKKLEQKVKSAVNDAVSAALQNQAAPQNVRNQPSADETAFAGLSWGPVMPAEENQFNYPGTYVEYFSHIFRDDFPGYNITYGQDPKHRSTIFTFWSGAGKALVVELLPRSSETNRLRNACTAQRIPYLRFYYNHEGWWNTRSYVSQRVRKALQG